MEVVITDGPEEAAVVAADLVQRLLETFERPVLGLATGSSPLPMYRLLINRYRSGLISFAHARVFLLDEYVGLDLDDPETYRMFIGRELTDHLDLPSGAMFAPDGSGDDPATSAAAYERLISEVGGIDLQVLGIGSDGHIGFNEPTSSLGARTRVKTLTRATRADNARFFDGDVDRVPRRALTQGIGTILEARRLVLIATGAGKADPVAHAVEGPLTAMVPASALQLHPRATVIVDEEAAADLRMADYYREAYGEEADRPRP